MIEELLDAQAEAEDEVRKKFYGVAVGTVQLTTDPLALGRVKVKTPFIDSSDLAAWARVATPMAGQQAGHYMIPEVGDEVLVAFEHGDVNAPYILGCLWNASTPPPLPSPLPHIRVIRTPLGNQVAFRETPPAITVTTPDMTQSASGLPPGITLASNTMITLLNEDFVILAKAKGLSDRRIRYRYVARNAILPQITSLALSVGFLLGGALVTEQVFNYPGLGKFTVTAIESRDYSFIQAQLLLLTMSVLVANLISDIANVILDPRLRKG